MNTEKSSPLSIADRLERFAACSVGCHSRFGAEIDSRPDGLLRTNHTFAILLGGLCCGSDVPGHGDALRPLGTGPFFARFLLYRKPSPFYFEDLMPASKFSFSLRIALLGLLFTLAACSLLGGEDPRWDTDVPRSAPLDALLGIWGPEGNRIAFVHTPDSAATEPGSYNQLWTYNLQTDTMRQVMRGPLFTPHWSPSGDRLVFHSPIPQYLFTVDPDGQNLQQLTGPDSPNPDLENTVVGKWSPSGKRILYTIEAGTPRGVSMMKPDGSSARILIEYGVQASWFPGGERIVYVNWDQSIEDGSRRKQIYVADTDGTNQRKLTDLKNSRDVGWPSVSPKGEQIAFAYNDQVHLMTADGTNVRQVTGGAGVAKQPVWSPDGETILFWRRYFDDPETPERLFLLDVETLEVEPVFPAEDH
ncbi:TolB family protein [Salinibacter sp.]|uniref:TolB family protein n=2 Tax=Salinibacter sp. TaxID=2065818 RepID=UPI0021E7E903|nr:hypothetical protein [Salinibacter sp.]